MIDRTEQETLLRSFSKQKYYKTKGSIQSGAMRIHLFTFICKKKKKDFIKCICTHDFSGVSFAAELYTKLVYNSDFVSL